MEWPYVPPDQIWMVVVGFIIAFILAFGIGANDVANSFGTSVGAKVLTLRNACILASIFETLGAILLGARVSDTIRKGIIDVGPYVNETELLMLGNVAALAGSGSWLVAATLLRMPVSATHSIVGATVGFALVAHGAKGINWMKLGMIIVSWFISPLFAGVVSIAIFCLLNVLIIKKENSLDWGLRLLPFIYAITTVVNVFSVFYDGPEMLGFDKIPLYGTFILSFGIGLIVAVVVRIFIVPWQRRVITANCKRIAEEAAEEASNEVKDTENSPEDKLNPDKVAIKVEEEETQDKKEASALLNGNAVGAVVNENNALPLHTVESELETVENAKNVLQGANNNHLARAISLDNESHDDNKPQGEKRRHHSDKQHHHHHHHKHHGPHHHHGYNPHHHQVGMILTELTTPPCHKVHTPPTSKKSLEKHAGKISKAEDAPLMDNEYNLGAASGAATPLTRSPSGHLLSEKLEKGAAAMNGDLKADPEVVIKKKLSVCESDESSECDSLRGRNEVTDKPETAQLFSFLQILTAVFGAFAHGGNDVSNAIGPLVSLWLIATSGQVAEKAQTPIWLLLYGGVGISIGLFVWGRRVIKTMGEDLTKITPSSGFCIEIGSALTTLIASNIGIPISTTHCKVGSIVLVGRFRAKENVDWSVFRNIVLAWLVTLPTTIGVSAGLMAIFMKVAL